MEIQMDGAQETCGSGWEVVFDGSAVCSSGACCSTHGLCGTSQYHCHYGLNPYWILHTGVYFISICMLWFLLGIQKQCIKLMEQYKKEGESVDAKVVQKMRRLFPFYCIMDDIRMCRRNQVVVEYSTGDHTRRIRKKLVVSGDTAQQAQETLRVLVLPGYPKSACPQTEVDSIILKRRCLLVVLQVSIFIGICYYLRASVKCLSIMNGPDNKRVGWILFWLNSLWTPPLVYLFLAKFVQRERWNGLLYEGEELSQAALPLLQA